MRRDVVVRRLLPLVAAVLVTAVGVFGLDVAATRGDVTDLRHDVAAARRALDVGDFAGVQRAVERAQADAGRIGDRLAAARWGLVRRLPLIGTSVTAVDRMARVAESATGLVDAHLRALLPLVDSGDWDLDAVEAAAAGLSANPADRLRVARDALAVTVPQRLLPGLAAARDEVLAAADEVLVAETQLGAATQRLPTFLGSQGPRRYVVVLQTGAELRGTGGLIGWWAVVVFTDGHVRLERFGRDNELYRATPITTPVPVDAGFARRYAHVDALGEIHSVNVDPDLPTVAPVLLDQFRGLVGDPLDGVVAIDPTGLATLLDGRELDLPDDLVPAGIPDPLPSADLASATMADIYELGVSSRERGHFLTAVAVAGFGELVALPHDLDVVRRVSRAAAGRHLQLYSTRPPEEDAFRVLGVDGRLAAPPGSDLLAVTANNAGANKRDVAVRHEFDADIELREPAAGGDTCSPLEREATVRVLVDNPDPGSRYAAMSREYLSRTWFTVWAPGDTSAVAAHGEHGEAIEGRIDRVHDHVAVDHFLDTPAGARTAFDVELLGTAPVICQGDQRRYELTWWRQAKAVPDDLDLRITVPAGCAITGVAAAGGRDPGLPDTTEEPTTAFGERTAKVAAVIGGDLEVSVSMHC